MLLPAIIFIGLAGWFMYSVDNRNPAKHKQMRRRSAQKDNVTLLPVFEEQPQMKVHNAVSNR